MNKQPARNLPWLLALAALLAATGAACPQMVQQYTAPLPRVLPPSPTLEQVIQAVNSNSEQIQSFSANWATLTGPGFPALRASVAFERAGRFRLRAETALTGPEIDVGSNDELFWFWVRRNQPPALYYCRHEQFAASPIRQMMPIEPEWLIEAMGITHFDLNLPHQGPYPLPGDRVEVRTIRETPQGPQTKVTIVDAIRGCVLQQQVYDFQGQLLASADAFHHRRDPATGLIMPTAVAIRSVPAQFAMRIDLGKVEINRPGGRPWELWNMPAYEGSAAVDLCDPKLQLPQGPAPVSPRSGAAPLRYSR